MRITDEIKKQEIKDRTMDYKLKKGKFIKNGHTMFEQDVLTDLKRLAYLEEEITKQLKLNVVI